MMTRLDIPAWTSIDYNYMASCWRAWFDTANEALEMLGDTPHSRNTAMTCFALYDDFVNSLEDHHENFDRDKFHEASGYTAAVARWSN